MRSGFTLVELVLVIAMLGIQAIILGPVLERSIRGYDVVWARRGTVAEARSAMDRMVKEIRLIPSSAQIVDISSAAQFQFQYPTGTAITYTLSGTDLLRNGSILARNVGLLEFKYYTAAEAETSTPANVRQIQIRMTLNAPSGQGSFPLRTRVFLRNMGTNYDNFTSP